jgi:hypothetical protein
MRLMTCWSSHTDLRTTPGRSTTPLQECLCASLLSAAGRLAWWVFYDSGGCSVNQPEVLIDLTTVCFGVQLQPWWGGIIRNSAKAGNLEQRPYATRALVAPPNCDGVAPFHCPGSTVCLHYVLLLQLEHDPVKSTPGWLQVWLLGVLRDLIF